MTLQICPQVYQVGGDGLSHPHDCCVYLVEANDSLALIDAGAGRGTTRILENIARCGFSPASVSYILITHGHIDHIGDCRNCRRRPEPRWWPMNWNWMRLRRQSPSNRRLPGMGEIPTGQGGSGHKADGETLTTGNTEFVFCTPGAHPGSLSILCRCSGLKVLFGQDIHGPFNKEWGSDIKEWGRSMQRLLELEADILCEGHFGIYQPATAVRDYIESYLRQYKR